MRAAFVDPTRPVTAADVAAVSDAAPVPRVGEWLAVLVALGQARAAGNGRNMTAWACPLPPSRFSVRSWERDHKRKGYTMRSNNSGCLTGIVAGFSRIMLLMAWIARPAMMNAAFSTFIIPCLGFLILPFTTLMYVLLWTPGVGIQGLDWLWLLLAAVMDLASIGAAGAANRNRIPPGYPGSYAEKELYDPVTGKPRTATPVAPPAPDQPTESKPQ